jgi:hypothetical protein
MCKESDTGARGVDSWEETNIDGVHLAGASRVVCAALGSAARCRQQFCTAKLKANEKLSMEGEKDCSPATRAMLRSLNSVPAFFFSVSASRQLKQKVAHHQELSPEPSAPSQASATRREDRREG